MDPLIFYRFSWMIAMTCFCITFVGLIAIAIKKISSKNSVSPINIPSISSQLSESIQVIHTSRIDEPQDTLELQAVQSRSGIIHVAPINLEEQSFESLENIGAIQTINMPIKCNEFISIGVENPKSEENLEAPNQILCFNNQKFNPNLISSDGLMLLFLISFILYCIFVWQIRFASELENVILKIHIIYCMPIALPIVYFILNPKHLTKARNLLFEGL